MAAVRRHRERETPEEKSARLKEIRKSVTRSRSAESAEATQIRLGLARKASERARRAATPDERQARRETVREGMASMRGSLSESQREERKAAERQYRCELRRRIFVSPQAGDVRYEPESEEEILVSPPVQSKDFYISPIRPDPIIFNQNPIFNPGPDVPLVAPMNPLNAPIGFPPPQAGPPPQDEPEAAANPAGNEAIVLPGEAGLPPALREGFRPARLDLGRCEDECPHCHALLWRRERTLQGRLVAGSCSVCQQCCYLPTNPDA